MSDEFVHICVSVSEYLLFNELFLVLLAEQFSVWKLFTVGQ